MAALGLDPYRYLTTTDPFERAMWVQIYNKTIDKVQVLMKNQAVFTALEVSKLFKK